MLDFLKAINPNVTSSGENATCLTSQVASCLEKFINTFTQSLKKHPVHSKQDKCCLFTFHVSQKRKFENDHNFLGSTPQDNVD